MQHEKHVLMTALRVLTAVTEWKEPDPHDILELKRLSPNILYVSADELACDVIHRTIQQRQNSAEREEGAAS
jgi:PHD/YefM family antitoxin component YafN of YafNO toxin-antitoxin module